MTLDIEITHGIKFELIIVRKFYRFFTTHSDTSYTTTYTGNEYELKLTALGILEARYATFNIFKKSIIQNNSK